MDDLIKNLNEDELYNLLPRQVSSDIKAFEKAGAQWDQIGTILAGSPSTNVALKGGNWSGELWSSVKNEFYKFLCTDSDTYSELRKEGNDLKEKSSKYLVASLSALIGSEIGISAGIIAPLIIWLLLMSSKIGKESICGALAKNR